MAFAPKIRVCDPEEHDFPKNGGPCPKCGCTLNELLYYGANWINSLPPRELECDEPGGEHVMVTIDQIERVYSEEEEKFLYCKFCDKKVPIG
jgi:hypothetical protein